MDNSNVIKMTREEYDANEKRVAEIDKLLHDLAPVLKEAREQGDLSENAEYDAAKDEQAKLKLEQEKIEEMLKHAEIVDNSEIKKGHIGLGSKVKILDIELDEEMSFQIVGATGANSAEGKMSNESPVGKALIGAKKGDVVTADTPAGPLQYKILKIEN